MVEAEFHAIWKSPDGVLIDITPGFDAGTGKSLFVIDPKRKFDGRQVDNVRLNTTTNELVDDMIDLEKARYRFMNVGSRANTIGLLTLSDEDARIWEEITAYSQALEQMYFMDWTLDTKCFCESGKSYGNCHRIHLKHFMSSI